jgi:hypothetical protein
MNLHIEMRVENVSAALRNIIALCSGFGYMRSLFWTQAEGKH